MSVVCGVRRPFVVSVVCGGGGGCTGASAALGAITAELKNGSVVPGGADVDTCASIGQRIHKPVPLCDAHTICLCPMYVMIPNYPSSGQNHLQEWNITWMRFDDVV